MSNELEHATLLVGLLSNLKAQGYDINPLTLRVVTNRLADLRQQEMEPEHEVG